MLKGFDENGNIQNVKVSESGEIYVKTANEEQGSTLQEVITTLHSSIVTAGAEATDIAINKKVTSIMVANYSETADVSVAAGGSTFVIGSGVATTLAVNKQVTNVSITATAEDTKVQVIIEGVE